MSVIYFIKENALVILFGIIGAAYFLVALNYLFFKRDKSNSLVKESESTEDMNISVPSKETIEELVTEDEQETVYYEPASDPIEEEIVSVAPTKKPTPTFEAKGWWKSLSTQDKRLYAFDAQLGDKKLSVLKSADILLIYNTFKENNQITTK